MRSFLQTNLRQETEENIDDSASSVSYENEKNIYRRQHGSTAGSKTFFFKLILYIEDNDTEENEIWVTFRFP